MLALRIALLSLTVLSVGSCGSGGLLGGGLPIGTIVNGLKEALSVGTNNAVGQTSQVGGFANNSLLRIALPGGLDDVAKGLRTIGMSSMLDDLASKMNTAAELASAKAAPVFLDAITQMTFADAKAILDGPDTAATDYFRQKTRPGLLTAYGPIVRDVMNQVGVVKDYNALLDTYNRIPFTSKPNLSIENYVIDKALDGLFTVVASEEQKIRTDPAARVTALLQTVFGGR